jgi:hypothetical protein
MQLAYYELGNVSDPRGIIHQANGELLVDKNEIIIRKLTRIRCIVIKGSLRGLRRFFRSEIVFDDAGEGTLYRTDRRFVYIRTPQPERHILSASMKRLEHASAIALSAKSWLREKKYECVSIPIIEIQRTNLRKNRQMLVIYTKSDADAQYKVQFWGENLTRI